MRRHGADIEPSGNDLIEGYAFEEFLEAAAQFHGYPAPGLILGACMVTAALRRLPDDILFDAICETQWCLPDAVQMLTPCTVGNGWLRVVNLGRYAVSLFNKFTGEGVRVFVDDRKLAAFDESYDWFMKRKPKHEQCSETIRAQIRTHASDMFTVHPVQIADAALVKRSKGVIGICPGCGEAYPVRYGSQCRSCQGPTPYATAAPAATVSGEPELRAVPVAEAVGEKALHDMTRIVPGRSKGPAFKRGQFISGGDVCRLQQMGRSRIYVEDAAGAPEGFVHEDRAARAFALAMCGPGTRAGAAPHEGKMDILADRDGLLVVDADRLLRFNLVPDVMAASRRHGSIVAKGDTVAGTRAIPLYLSQERFETAVAVIGDAPLFTVNPIAAARIGILVTGTEVFQGLVQDRFAAIIAEKTGRYGCPVAGTIIAPDDPAVIAGSVARLIDAGTEVLVTTAGLSVDPDDVTRKGLQDAGVTDIRYGAAVLPGAMTLLGRIGDVRVIGVPACALFHGITSFDVLLPRLLAGLDISRADLARLGHGGLCMNCPSCSYPKCRFGG